MSKLCNAKFLSICSDPHLVWPEEEYIFSKLFILRQTIPLRSFMFHVLLYRLITRGQHFIIEKVISFSALDSKILKSTVVLAAAGSLNSQIQFVLDLGIFSHICFNQQNICFH